MSFVVETLIKKFLNLEKSFRIVIESVVAFEGTTAVAVLSNTTAAIRNNAGCADSNDNATDFTVATPAPRNSSTEINTCCLSVVQNEISGLNVYPNPVTNGILNITTDNNDAKPVILLEVLGKEVINITVTDQPINVASFNFIKITEAGKAATRKLVIK